MLTHIRKNKSTIYRKASQRVIKDLDRFFESKRKKMKKAAHYLVDVLVGDYRTIILSSEMLEASEMAREHIHGVLYEVDSQYDKVLCMEHMNVDSAQLSQPDTVTAAAVPTTPGAPETDASEGMAMDP